MASPLPSIRDVSISQTPCQQADSTEFVHSRQFVIENDKKMIIRNFIFYYPQNSISGLNTEP